MFVFISKPLNLADSNKVPKSRKRKVFVVFCKHVLRLEPHLQIILNMCSYRFVFDPASVPRPAPVVVPVECNLDVMHFFWR